MLRYLVLAWDPENGNAAAFAGALAARCADSTRRWRVVLREEGVLALLAGGRCESGDALALQGGAGVVLGELFERAAPGGEAHPVFHLDRVASERILATVGRHLTERYWGRYVAVLRDGVRRETIVLRDPSGALPCFLVTFEGVRVFFSDIEDCLQVGLGPFSVNRDYVAAFVCCSALQLRATGLCEVSEVQAGERIRLCDGEARRDFAWNPVRIARESAGDDGNAAAEALGAMVRSCVSAWVGRHPGLVLTLSGGLDSSIVLSCMRRASPSAPLTCVHYHAPGRDADERRYARLMAQRARAKLVEHPIVAARLSLERLLEIRRSPRPWSCIHEIERSGIENRVAAEAGATGIVSGGGGDAVFYQSRADLAVADFLRRRGLRSGLLRVALDAAHITRRSIWSLLGAALVEIVRLEARNPLAEALRQRTLVTAAARECASRCGELLHPWFAAGEAPDPGKAWQIFSLSFVSPVQDAFGREDAPERIMPLLSQPLVELALRTPTYLCVAGGRDRSLARRAFADDLPVEIVSRCAKGAIDHYGRDVLDRNLPWVRDLLLGGLLVRERMLDRARLERYLSGPRSPADFEYNEILHQHLCTEAWLRRWQGAGAFTSASTTRR